MIDVNNIARLRVPSHSPDAPQPQLRVFIGMDNTYSISDGKKATNNNNSYGNEQTKYTKKIL